MPNTWSVILNGPWRRWPCMSNPRNKATKDIKPWYFYSTSSARDLDEEEWEERGRLCLSLCTEPFYHDTKSRLLATWEKLQHVDVVNLLLDIIQPEPALNMDKLCHDSVGMDRTHTYSNTGIRSTIFLWQNPNSISKRHVFKLILINWQNPATQPTPKSLKFCTISDIDNLLSRSVFPMIPDNCNIVIIP